MEEEEDEEDEEEEDEEVTQAPPGSENPLQPLQHGTFSNEKPPPFPELLRMPPCPELGEKEEEGEEEVGALRAQARVSPSRQLEHETLSSLSLSPSSSRPAHAAPATRLGPEAEDVCPPPLGPASEALPR